MRDRELAHTLISLSMKLEWEVKGFCDGLVRDVVVARGYYRVRVRGRCLQTEVKGRKTNVGPIPPLFINVRKLYDITNDSSRGVFG
jgi:hypothetical protein